MATRYGNKTLGLRLRLVLRRGAAFGPGKADLLDQIAATGSIAAAGRRLGMSYTRAWGLVDEMNSEFRGALVESAKGGAARGGACLTALGSDVLKRYRRMERTAARAVTRDLSALRKRLA